VFAKSDLEETIDQLQYDITACIRESDDKLRDIIAYEPRSDIDRRVKENAQSILAKKLQSLTHDVRRDQRQYMSKVQELHGVTEEADPEEMFESLDLSTVEEQKYDNKEIERLAKSM